jgi:hypothetical protein
VIVRAYLDEQEEVRILTLGRRSLGLLYVVSLEVDTLHNRDVEDDDWTLSEATSSPSWSCRCMVFGYVECAETGAYKTV